MTEPAANKREMPWEPSSSPDIRTAIGKALQSAAALVGPEAVVNHFKQFNGNIIRGLIPLDAGGLIRAKGEALTATEINSLLSL